MRCYAIETRPSANVRKWSEARPGGNADIALHRMVLGSTCPYNSTLIWYRIAVRIQTPHSWYSVWPGGDVGIALRQPVLLSTRPYNSTLIWLQTAVWVQTPHSWYGVGQGGTSVSLCAEQYCVVHASTIPL